MEVKKQYPLRLSVIVPMYRVEQYVERCLRSIENQDIPKDDYEVIAVDDGTPDRSAEIAEQLGQEYGNIRVIHKANGGLSSARNAGMRVAQGKYLMFVDSDDFVNSNTIRPVLEKAEAQQAELCFYWANFYPSNGHPTNVQPFELNHIYTGEYILLHGMFVSSAWCNLYLHATLDRLGMRFREGINHEDIEFNYRLYPLVQRVMYVDDIVYNYNIEGESIMRTKDLVKQEKNTLDRIRGKRSILDFLADKPISPNMRRFIHATINSEMVAICLELIRNNGRYRPDFLSRAIACMRQNGLYPVHGRTLSWKTSLLRYPLNCEGILRMLSRLHQMK